MGIVEGSTKVFITHPGAQNYKPNTSNNTRLKKGY